MAELHEIKQLTVVATMKNSCWQTALYTILFTVSLGLSTLTYSADGDDTISVADFTAMQLDDDGHLVKLSDYADKVVLLNFWASWCFPCLYEMPMFQKLYDEFKDQGLTIIAVAVYDEFADAKAYSDKNNFSFPVLFDHLGEAKTAFDVEVVPQTFLIGRDSKLIPIPSPSTGEKKLKVIDPTIWEHSDTKAFFKALLGS